MTALFRFPKRKLRKMVARGDYREALEFGAGLEKRYSRDPDFLFIMGGIYYMLELADDALRYFDRALEISPSDTEALHLKARVHLALGSEDEARRCCRRILEIDPEHEGAREIAGG